MRFKSCTCGSTVFYIRQQIKGTCNFCVNADGSVADNSNMHDFLIYTNLRTYYRCVDCDKRAREVEDEIS